MEKSDKQIAVAFDAYCAAAKDNRRFNEVNASFARTDFELQRIFARYGSTPDEKAALAQSYLCASCRCRAVVGTYCTGASKVHSHA